MKVMWCRRVNRRISWRVCRRGCWVIRRRCRAVRWRRSRPARNSVRAIRRSGSTRCMIDGGKEMLGPIINVTPEAGQSAEFVLENTAKGATPLLTAHLVRTAQGAYGFTVVSNEIPVVALARFELTFWGVPADPSHDPMRGRYCTTSSRNCDASFGVQWWW